MKLVHTADVHIDRCYAGAGFPPSLGNRLRKAVRDSFHAVIERAGAWPADALLIAGDLFDRDRITRETISFLQGEFASIGHVPVFIAPGSADPCTPASPYAVEDWPKNVTIFRTPEWQSVALQDGQVRVHGFGFDKAVITKSPFGTLKLEQSPDVTHVAVGYGCEKQHQPVGQPAWAPFDAADAAPEGLTYFALGQFHKMTAVEGSFAAKLFYSGAPQGHGFREAGPRHFLEVEIAGGEVRVSPVESSRLQFAMPTLTCDQFSEADDVVSAVRSATAAAGSPQVVRVTLTGLCLPTVQAELGSIQDALAPEYEYLELIDKTEPAEDYLELAREATSLGSFIQTLNQEIADATDEAKRQLLGRARELGLAAFRGRDLEVRGMERA